MGQSSPKPCDQIPNKDVEKGLDGKTSPENFKENSSKQNYIMYINGESAPYPNFNQDTTSRWINFRRVIYFEAIFSLLMIFLEFFNNYLSKNSFVTYGSVILPRFLDPGLYVGGFNLALAFIGWMCFREKKGNKCLIDLRFSMGLFCLVFNFFMLIISFIEISAWINDIYGTSYYSNGIPEAGVVAMGTWLIVIESIKIFITFCQSATLIASASFTTSNNHYVFVCSEEPHEDLMEDRGLDFTEICDKCRAQINIPPGSLVLHYCGMEVGFRWNQCSV